MIVWGGASRGRLFADGAAYDPATDRWRILATAPIAGRTAQTSVWTGAEMIVWGGCCERRGAEFGDGAAYNPASDSWRKLSPAPIGPRTSHTAVWTGDQMLVWGGHVFEQEHSDGAAYDPEANRWQSLPLPSIEPRYSHSAVWSGEAMIVWGGATMRPSVLADGALLAGGWRPIKGVRPGRSSHTAVWTGSEMLVWGGCCDASGRDLPGGAAYEPEDRRWRALSDSGLGARQAHVAVWANNRMIVWGGQGGLGERFADGAAYDSAADRWAELPPSPLDERAGPTGVWTDDELIVWGGCCDGGQRAFADGAGLLVPDAEPFSEVTPSEDAAEPPLEPRDADNGVGALIALGGIILLAVVVGFARALRKRPAQ